MFKSQRINDQVYIESSDGSISLSYPYKSGSQVKGLVDAAELMLPENEPTIRIGATVGGVGNAMAAFDRIREAAAIEVPGTKKPRKHREAKRLVDKNGKEFKLALLIEERIRTSKQRKIKIDDIIEEIRHHYTGNPHYARNAIRISAMKSERFSIVEGYLVERTEPEAGKKAV